MKKALALFLAAFMLLGLAACGGAGQTESGSGTVSLAEETPDVPEAPPTPQGEPVTASYTLNTANMRLTLPTDWEYAVVGASVDDGEAQAEADDIFGIEFWPAADPELKLSLLYYVNDLGMCGTGVTIEEVSYANGLRGWKYTEKFDSEGKTSLNIIFAGLAGNYAMSGLVPTEKLEKYGDTIDAIIESAVLSEGNLTEAEAIAAAEAAVTVDYDTVRAYYDFAAGEWWVHFSKENTAGGGQSVRLDGRGNVIRAEYGE